MRKFVAHCVVFMTLSLIIGAGVASLPAWSSSVSQPVVEAALSKLGRGISDVVLTDEAGHAVRWRELDGRPRAVFFGFTHCPVICPVTVWELDAALKKIGSQADSLQIVFVTLDPERDTPGVLKSYFSAFKGRVRGLTGASADIDRMARSFEVVRERVALSGGDYTLDHTAAVYLLDADGVVVDTLAFGAAQDVIVKRLENLMERAALRKN